MRGIYHATVWPIVSDTTNAVPTFVTARAIRYTAVRRSCSIMNDRNAPMNGVTKVSHVEDAVKPHPASLAVEPAAGAVLGLPPKRNETMAR